MVKTVGKRYCATSLTDTPSNSTSITALSSPGAINASISLAVKVVGCPPMQGLLAANPDKMGTNSAFPGGIVNERTTAPGTNTPGMNHTCSGCPMPISASLPKTLGFSGAGTEIVHCQNLASHSP